MEGWQKMAELYGNISNTGERCMVHFPLSIVHTSYRMMPTQVICLCCRLDDYCVVVGIYHSTKQVIEACSLADDYNIVNSELED